MRAMAISLAAVVAVGAFAPAGAGAAVIYTDPGSLTTVPNPGGGCCDGTGVWFNPLTGYAETRGFLFPDTLLEDGKFFLLTDASGGGAQAQIYTQGLFSRGNGVIYDANNPNPARFSVGESIGPGSGYQNPGSGFPDLGPAFGNWAPGRGFLGLTLRDPSGSSSSDFFYGFADITVNEDYTITLNAFAYENVRGEAITTSFKAPAAVPEPSSYLLFGAGLAGMAGWARRRRPRE